MFEALTSVFVRCVCEVVSAVDINPPFPPVMQIHSHFLFAAHSEVSREHAAATVPGYVPRHRGQRGDLPDGHEEHVQPQTGGAQEVRPQGEEELHGSLTFFFFFYHCFSSVIHKLMRKSC